MRVRVLTLALVCAAVVAASSATAEPLGAHFEITPVGGYTLFDTALRPTGNGSLRDAAYLGFRVGYHMRPWWGFELAAGTAPTNEDIPGPQTADHGFIHGSGNLVFTPLARPAGGPFLSLGAGAARITHVGAGHLNQGTLDLAAGVRFWLTDAVGVRLEARNIRRVGHDFSFDNADYVVLSGGISVALGGRMRDTDGDGVGDKIDRCPSTPAGARVDVNGCPTDADGDKVFDGLDKCDATPQGCTVDANGCPTDADGDGVCDGVDQSPDTPKGATVDATGTPKDTDGDKVFDGLDKCQGTQTGCTVDSLGCPTDADGDGVCDGLDNCPDTSRELKVDKNGCPIEMVERETELFDTGMIRLQNVNFETNKADLMPESFPTLDIVGQILAKWPDLRIEVGGHTDSRGSDAHNRRLSAARADSVLAYVTRKYPTLKPEQYTAKGYGESVPLVPNTTPLNMAKNRRVEFVVLNKEVLKKEVERRRLLRQMESGTAPRDSQPVQPDSIRSPAPPDTTRR